MKHPHGKFPPSMMSVALLLAFGSAAAQDASVDELTKPDSSVSIGAGNWSNDRHHQGVYDAMREKGTYGLVDVDINKRDDATGTWLKLRGTNLGLDNRELRGEYNRQGNFGGFFEYNRITSDNPYSFSTRTQGIGTTNLTVGNSQSTFPRSDVELGIRREMVRLGGYTNIAPGLDFKLDFKNETKTGTRQTGWGSAALFSVEPLDSTTRQLESILQYTGEKLQLSGGYIGSWYDNDNPLILEKVNGTTLASGSGSTPAQSPGITPLSQPLSNQAHQLFLDGGYNFTPTTRGTFKAAFTRATQDEHNPSYDLTGVSAPWSGAPSHLDGQVNTTLLQLGLSSRPLPKLSITGNLRYYDVNDKTPLRGFVGTGATATVFNTPQSFTTTSGKLEATYRLPMNYSVTGGVDYSSQDRSYPTVGTIYVPFRADIKETTYRAQVKRALSDSVNGTIAYLHSTRDGSDYIQAEAATENKINPIHIADRIRDKIRASFDWDPTEALSLQFRADYSKDKYPRDGRPYGLQDGSSQVYSIDATYAISDNWKLSAWYSYDMTKARTLNERLPNGSTVVDAYKDTHIEDAGSSLGISLRGKLAAKLEGGLDIDWFRNTSNYTQSVALVGAATNTNTQAPEVRNNLTRIKLDGKYAVDKASDLRFDLVYELWKTNDATWTFANGSPFMYATSGVTLGSAASDGTTVTANPRQSAVFFGVRYIYRFQ